MSLSLPNIQLVLRPGIVDLGWGHPDPALLPVADMAAAAVHALDHDGAEALAYGAEQGPGRLIEPLRARLGRLEDTELAADQVFITGGISHALDLLCTLLTRPGDIVLVEAPTYHLAQRIFRDHQLELVPVAADGQGLQIDAVEAALDALRRRQRQPKLLYTVPTFSNPTGVSLAAERRQALVDLARRNGLLILEDDAYRELWYELPPPPALYSLAPAGPVIRLGSFAKILAPGLRLGWLTAAPSIVQQCVKSGVLDSGGGVNHFTAHVVAALFELDMLDRHIGELRSAYRRRRDALLVALARHLPPECTWLVPYGGFFVWVSLPPGLNSNELLARAASAGVAFLSGTPFLPDGGEQFLRLSFSLLPLDELAEGARRLGQLLRWG